LGAASFHFDGSKEFRRSKWYRAVDRVGGILVFGKFKTHELERDVKNSQR